MKKIFDHEKKYIWSWKNIWSGKKYFDQENLNCCKSDSLSISPRRLFIMNVSNYFYYFSKTHIFVALTQSLGVVSPLSPSLSPLLHSALID